MTDERQIHLSAKNAYEKDGGVFFFNIDFNSLFRVDLSNYSIRHLNAFLEYQTEDKGLFGDFVVENNDELFFFPGIGDFIGIYNAKLNEGEKVRISSKLNYDKNVGLGVAKIIASSKKVWIFLAETSFGVYVLDMDNHQVQKDFELSKKIKEYKPLVWKLEQEYGNRSYVQTGDLNLLLQIDVVKKNIVEIRNPVPDGVILGENEGKLWFYNADSLQIYEWKVNLNELSVYDVEDENLVYDGREDGMPPYARCVCFGGEVFILGWSIRAIMRLNKEKKTIERAFAFPEGFYFYKYKKVSHLTSNFWSAEMIKGKIYFFPCAANMLLIYDPQSGEVEGKELVVEKSKIKNYEKIINNKLLKEVPLDETENFFSIYDCLEYGQKMDDTKREMQENIGERIWMDLNDKQ